MVMNAVTTGQTSRVIILQMLTQRMEGYAEAYSEEVSGHQIQ